MGGKGSGGTNKRYDPRPLMDDAPLWERQPAETAKAFASFVAYRDLGPERSQATAAKLVGKSPSSMGNWGHQWSWLTRAEAWDAHLESINVETQETEASKANARHLKLAQVVTAIGESVMGQLTKKFKTGGKVEFSAADALNFVERGIKLEKLLMGEATERTAHTIEAPKIDPKTLTTQQLRRIIKGEDARTVVEDS